MGCVAIKVEKLLRKLGGFAKNEIFIDFRFNVPKNVKQKISPFLCRGKMNYEFYKKEISSTKTLT